MAEEKQENERRGIVKLIFKWIGLGLLVALIIGALAFDAPWKVIALLLITLAAHTILPKGTVKWFWLSAAAVVIVLIVWVFLPENDEGWRPYTFDEELAALEAKYAVPDEENAAVIYNQLFANYNEYSIVPNISNPNIYYLTWSEPWTSDEYPQVAEWLKGHENTIAKLIEASKFEKCSFPIVADVEAFSQHMEIVAPMRQWAYLLVCAANNDLAEGRIDQAIEKNLTLLQMEKHMCQQPITIDTLVGISIEALAIYHFNRFVVTGDVTEEHLNVIERALAGVKHEWSSDLIKFFETDKIFTKRLFANYYEINPKGKIRLSHDPGAKYRDQFRKHLQEGKIENERIKKSLERFVYPSYMGKKLIKARTIKRWFYIPSNPQKASKIIDSVYERYYAMTAPDFDWQKEPSEVPVTSLFSIFNRINYARLIECSARMSEETYYSLHYIYLRHIAENRCSQILIALRRYKDKKGHWPESLEEVKSIAPAEIFIDPINGSSFVYKLTEEGFTLYSKGKNNIDEDGKRDRWDEEKTGADDWLIWPQKSRKTKEENTNAEQQ